jgi:hypothetical protein
MAGKHGSTTNETEVPRRPLVDALEAETDFFTTQSLKRTELFHDVVVPLKRRRTQARRKR